MSIRFDDDGKLACDCCTYPMNNFNVFVNSEANINIVCSECGCSVNLGGAYLKTEINSQMNNHTDPETVELEMTITKEQADYWEKVALLDIRDGNREGAWNVHRWLKENNALDHAVKLRNALKAKGV